MEYSTQHSQVGGPSYPSWETFPVTLLFRDGSKHSIQVHPDQTGRDILTQAGALFRCVHAGGEFM